MVLHHDFAEDVLPKYIDSKTTTGKSDRVVLNVNPYIRSEDTRQKLITYAQSHHAAWYFPAEIGVDDAFFANLVDEIDGLTLYDWTQYDLQTVCRDI